MVIKFHMPYFAFNTQKRIAERLDPKSIESAHFTNSVESKLAKLTATKSFTHSFMHQHIRNGSVIDTYLTH